MKYTVSETKENAYRSLKEALEAARAGETLLAEGEGVTLSVEGTVYQGETLRIRPEDLPPSIASGIHPLTVEGAGDGAVLAGGVRLEGFSRWKDNVWRVEIPQYKNTRHLYIDGRMARRPRTEETRSYGWDVLQNKEFELYDLPGAEKVETAYKDQPGIKPRTWSGIATTHTEILNWKNLRDVEMIFNVGWVHRIVPIESAWMLEDGRLFIQPVTSAFESSLLCGGVQIGGCPNYFENVFECLSRPLEWYYDKAEKALYLCLEEGDVPENHEIILPQAEQLIELAGTVDHPLCRITFRHLTFAYTTWLRPQIFGLPEVQASQLWYYRIPEELKGEKPYEAEERKIPPAVRVLAAHGVCIEECTFRNLGTGAVMMEFGTRDSRIESCEFYEIAGSAVTVGDFYLERAHHPEDPREIVQGIAVENNDIHDIGRDFFGSVAVIAGYVQDLSVCHNDIHQVPYSAVSVGWGWGNSDVAVGPYRPTSYTVPSVCKRNRIMNNHIDHCMMELSDGGAIYTLGAMDGTVISGNYIHESAGYHGKGYDRLHVGGYQSEPFATPEARAFWQLHGIPGGIYMDEGSRGIEVFGNVLHDVAVPLFYHNQIDRGYTMVDVHDNILNRWPGEEGFPIAIAACAGRRPEIAAGVGRRS